MKIQMVAINEIKPYWRNPRDNEAAVDAVKESIKRYGFNQPLVVDTENVIVVGHVRYKALLELGWKKVPCVVVDLSPELVRQYRIADNKTAEIADWDLDKLIAELRTIPDVDGMQPFFQDIDLAELIKVPDKVPGTKSIPVTEAYQNMTTRFDNLGQRQDQTEVACPYCGESFFIDAE